MQGRSKSQVAKPTTKTNKLNTAPAPMTALTFGCRELFEFKRRQVGLRLMTDDRFT